MKYILEKASVKYYSEIMQQKKIGFSFCNKEGNVLKQMFHWVVCRDFLSDVLFAEETQEKVSKYCFVYNPIKNKIDRDKTRLLLKFYNSEDVVFFKDNLDILNRIEKNNRLLLTTIVHIEKDVYLVEGSKMWLNSTFSLHLYTFLLKIIAYSYVDKNNWVKEVCDLGTNEGWYARNFIPEFENIINKHLRKLFNKPLSIHGYEEDYANVSYVHDNGGVVSLFRKGAFNYLAMKNNEYYKRLSKFL